MIIPLKLPNPQQHERIFLEDAINKYRDKLSTAAGFIFSILKIYRAKGQKLIVSSSQAFYTHFGIPKSTFYKALNRLENTPGLNFHWQPTGGMAIWYGKEEEEEEEAAPEPKYKRLKDLPDAIKAEFEAFIRTEWRKTKGEEIRSFHRFLDKSADFQNWWQKFQQREISAPVVTTAAAPEPQIGRGFSPFPASLKGKSPFQKPT